MNSVFTSGHEFIFKAEDNRIVVFDAIANITRTIVHDYIVVSIHRIEAICVLKTLETI